MGKLLLKLGILGAFALLVFTVELWLPIDQFTFRSWEAVFIRGASRNPYLPPGYFYPSYKLTRTELGDIAAYTPYQVAKQNIHWETDQYGFRNTIGDCRDWPVIVAGDSLGVGTSLTQDEILASQVSKRLGRCVYNMSGIRFNEAGPAAHQIGLTPKTVIYVVSERLNDVIPLHSQWLSSDQTLVRESFWTPLWVAVDRLSMPALPAYRNRHGIVATLVRAIRGPGPEMVDGAERKMRFYFGKDEALSADARVDKIANGIVGLRDKVAAQGIRFVFIPVPTKESIYPELIPATPPGNPYLPALYAKLKAAGVDYVDLYTPFRQAYLKSGKLHYHLDDTHWNSEGVGVASRAVAELLGK